jgi:membrane protein DedA with SNARE-associated domain
MPTFLLREWIDLLKTLYDQYGYLIVLLGTLGENTVFLSLFLPGNLLVLLGAVYARVGTLNLGWVIFFASLGTIFGYHVDYLIGRFVLVHVVAGWSKSRLGRRLRLAGRLRLARMLITRHGGKAILISHLIGHLRSFVALSAGMTRMSYRYFLGYELIAASLWSTFFCLLGYFLATEIDQLQVLFARIGWILVGLLILLFLLWYVVRKRVKRRLQQTRRAARHKARSRAGDQEQETN